MAHRRRPLRFAVSTALLVAPASLGCTGSGEKHVNEGPIEQPEEPIDIVNEGPKPDPQPQPQPQPNPTLNPTPEPTPPIEERVNPGPMPEPTPPPPEPPHVNTGPKKTADAKDDGPQ